MKKLILSLLLFTALTNAQIVNITDANLKARLLASDTSNSIAQVYEEAGGGNYVNVKLDINNDGEIQLSEALAVNAINVNSQNNANKVSSLSGLEAFANLKVLNCDYNEITTLDITSFPDIYNVNCAHNLITNINVHGIPFINQLMCSYNLIVDIDLTGVDYIEDFYIDHNQLTTLSATHKTFSGFDCSFNNLTQIDLSSTFFYGNAQIHDNPLISFMGNSITIGSYISFHNMPNLTTVDLSNCDIVYLYFDSLPAVQTTNFLDSGILYLSVINSNLPQVDFSSLETLREVVFNNNQTAVLDFPGSRTLDRAEIKNNANLTWLGLKNGANESPVIIQNNPNLNYVCVDDSQITYMAGVVGGAVSLNTYCTFTPGGGYNTITGNITFDSDNNGCDVSDPVMPAVKLGLSSGATFTNSSGNYSFYALATNFTIVPNLENQSWFTIAPPSATITFTEDQNNSATQNFCITSNGVHPDAETVIIPIDQARPGFDATYKVIYKNKGNQVLSGTVDFTFEDDILDYISASTIPDTQNTRSLSWNYANLQPFESREFTITFNVNSPMELPAVNIGDNLDFSATINPVSGDETPLDNNFGFKQFVVGSLDPNDKTCLEGAQLSPTKIGDYLHYNINFENTGNFQAENIVVRDVIDAAKFDVSTLQLLSASHQLTTITKANKVEFIFENINLGAGQHGNVAFKIKTKSTLTEGTIVSNKADIYFDYNFPVETNPANTIFQTLGIGEHPTDDSIRIYPNPTLKILNISAGSNVKKVELFDVQGRILEVKRFDGNLVNLTVSSYSKGVYFIRMTSENGIKTERFIKE